MKFLIKIVFELYYYKIYFLSFINVFISKLKKFKSQYFKNRKKMLEFIQA